MGEVIGPTQAPAVVALLISHPEKLAFKYLYLSAQLSVLTKDASSCSGPWLIPRY